MYKKNKRGLSPVIATVLLISISLILAVIIFFWAKSFVGESIEKGERDIAQSCNDVVFRAEVIDSEEKLFIENTGRVPIFGAEIRKQKVVGDIREIGTFDNQNSIHAGETGEIDLSGNNEINVDDKLEIVPILLGETAQYKKAHVCDRKFGIETIVK